MARMASVDGHVKAIMANDPLPLIGHDGQMTRVQEIMRARGIKAAELARRVGRDPSTVHKVVTGKRELRRHWAEIFAPVLEVTADELLAAPGQPFGRTASAPTGRSHHLASHVVALARGAAHEAIQNAGPRLRATRQALGIRTAEELAAEIGADPADVARWEEGLPPDLAALAVLKLRRGVPLDWLLLGDDTALPPLLLHALVQQGGAGLAFRGGLPRGMLPEPDSPPTKPRSVHDAPYEEAAPPRST